MTANAARTTSPLAGKTVEIRTDAVHIGGRECRVEDWWINVFGISWTVSERNPAALQYAMRSALSGLPLDDEVLYGKVDGFGFLVHVTEIEVPS